MDDEAINCQYYLNKIESIINLLVETQKKCNEILDNMTCESYTTDVELLTSELTYEQELLKQVTYNLNRLFNLKPSRYSFLNFLFADKFRIINDEYGRYVIKPPIGLNKTGREYFMLKKLLIRLHEHYFLSDGSVGYVFSSVESHMWEIPSFVEENELIRSIKKQIQKSR